MYSWDRTTHVLVYYTSAHQPPDIDICTPKRIATSVITRIKQHFFSAVSPRVPLAYYRSDYRRSTLTMTNSAQSRVHPQISRTSHSSSSAAEIDADIFLSMSNHIVTLQFNRCRLLSFVVHSILSRTVVCIQHHISHPADKCELSQTLHENAHIPYCMKRRSPNEISPRLSRLFLAHLTQRELVPGHPARVT